MAGKPEDAPLSVSDAPIFHYSPLAKKGEDNKRTSAGEEAPSLHKLRGSSFPELL